MWNCNDKIVEIFNKLNDGKTSFPCTCPVCGECSGHVYIQRHDENHCGIWTWCSSCGSYSHMSGETPAWWKNPNFIDENLLYSEPEYLEKMKDKIDIWINNIVPTDRISSNEPFVIEDKFKVKLKEELQGIPVGTKGILVIKNDFKTIEIEFIDSSGKIINLDMPPKKVSNVFEVIDK